MPQRRPVDDRHQRGVSLIEIIITIAIAAIVIGMAVPSFQRSFSRQRIVGRTAELLSDLAYARTEALSRNRTVLVSFQTDALGGCYVLHTGANGDCVCSAIAQTQCKNGAIEIRTSLFPSDQPVDLQPPKGAKPYIAFSQSRGTATPAGSITLSTANHVALTAVVAQTGRVRVCSTDINALPGYKSCI